MLKPFRTHILNHATGKHLSMVLDAADPIRNDLLEAMASAFDAAGRTAEAEHCRKQATAVIVTKGQGLETVPVATQRTVEQHVITNETIRAPRTHGDAVAPLTVAKLSEGKVIAEGAQGTSIFVGPPNTTKE